MRNIFLLMLSVVLFACSNEDIESSIVPEDFYVIKDYTDADSAKVDKAVQQQRYAIYKEYGVSVFFNDTIGKVFIKNDFQGNPVYQTEMIDFAWNFSSSDNITYSYDYITDAEKQKATLSIIEAYLAQSPKALLPFSILAVNTFTEINKQDEESVNEDKYKSGFRATLFAITNDTVWNEAKSKEVSRDLTYKILLRKISLYENFLAEFNDVTNKDFYDKSWIGDLGVKEDDLVWAGTKWLYDIPDFYNLYIGEWHHTQEEADAKLATMRAAVGPFGFIGSSNKMSSRSPENVSEDREYFIKQMFLYTSEEFEALWGDYPLVMKKYDIISNVLKNKLGIEL